MKFLTKILLFTFLILNSTFIISQNADCDKLLVLKDTIYHAKNIVGYGDKLEFDGNELENNKLFEKEQNSIWYLITIPDSGVFTFDIISENDNDDWDFLLYEYKNLFCKRIDANRIKPIRSNLSRSATTGLSESANNNFESAGINTNYSKALNVNKGEQYVLVVNNPKQNGSSHTLLLHYPSPKKIIKPKENLVIAAQTKFEIVIKDKGSDNLVKSTISITGLGSKSLVVNNKSVFVKFLSKKNRTVHVTISAKGYMLYDNQVKVSKNKSNFSYEIFLEPITVGSKVNLKQIQFYGNRYDMLPTAKPSLKSLLKFMQENPTVKIEVEGHVNGPRQRNSKSYQELSYNRALAVKDYLITNGIADNRVDYKGYGNEDMLYPTPKSAYQESANRRVEIKIIGL